MRKPKAIKWNQLKDLMCSLLSPDGFKSVGDKLFEQESLIFLSGHISINDLDEANSV